VREEITGYATRPRCLMAEPDPFLILIEIPVSRCVFGATISLEKKLGNLETRKLGNSEIWKLK